MPLTDNILLELDGFKHGDTFITDNNEELCIGHGIGMNGYLFEILEIKTKGVMVKMLHKLNEVSHVTH